MASTQSPVPRVGVVFRPRAPEKLAGFAAIADQSGLDDLWLWEDCFLEGGLTAATAALAWTTSIRVGLGLMPAPFRNPALAAMEIATLARLFPGRFAPATGNGVQPWMQQTGAAVASPLTLLREWTTAVRTLLHGQQITASGEYVRLADVALDWPPLVIPPLLIGGTGPRTLALAGEIADGLVLHAGQSPDDVRRAARTAAIRPGQELVVYVTQASDVAPDAVARVICAYADAGATAVILQVAEPDASDDDALAALAAKARRMVRGE
jgi:alkanesulfonate monooxygenase SsuD/methylene tetrahydromethanopterin reductase-like flavin-dependent oxidoreductase (luciferase family)